ncbi:MAG TPA: PfkB family carbohydrate kinase [Pyrinomonadaceae bacterium]
MSAGFAGKHVVVIGDAVADQFLEGTISRVSREAPVFILRHDDTVTLPGAAANAAANVAALGAKTTLIALCGGDVDGQALRTCLADRQVDTDGLIEVGGLRTTTKVRILAGHSYATRQQVIRVDYENTSDIGDGVSDRLIDKLQSAGETADAIVVSDYGYGAITTALFAKARRIAAERSIPLMVDSRHRLTEFVGATSATPNSEEAEHILGSNFNDDDCSRLREQLGLNALLVTNGNRGMTLFESGHDPVKISAVGSVQPVDVTGAGDTVIAAYTLALAAGMSFRQAAEIANRAGGIVVMKKGTATVTQTELLESLSKGDGASLTQSK